jgi:hypothetical protein
MTISRGVDGVDKCRMPMTRICSISCGVAMAVMACVAVVDASFAEGRPCAAATPTGPPRHQQFAKLVCVRASAIETAFGPLFDGQELDIRLQFAASGDPRYPQASMSTYDPAEHTLYFRRGVLHTPPTEWYRWALAYWPYYQDDLARDEFPVVGIIDGALWDAHLRQAAHEHGLTWPHPECGSIDIARRLGCEMLVTATAELSQSPVLPLYNANRADRLWPENLEEFERRAWTRGGREYRDVRRLGGLLLIEPLIREFGAPRVFAYVARTPFLIENRNVRSSALRYQEQARSALAL